MIYLVSVFVLSNLCLKAQQHDTIFINVEQAKAMLLKENLSILSTYYEIDIAEAQLMQTKAWNNPYFNWNQDMYSVELDEYFNYKNQFLVQVDQVFSFAGKHTNTVKLAKVNSEINKMMMKDVVRSLLMELTENYHQLYGLQQKQFIYDQVLERYSKVIEASETQLKLGAIAQNEVIRLKSEQIAIQTEALQIANDQLTVMGTLRVMLNLKPTVYIVTSEYKPLFTEPGLADLLKQSEENRTDFKLAQLNKQYQQVNLKLQKSLAYPDITFGYQPKDRGSNYVRPYSGIEVGFEIPLFNRNTGNIRIAEFEIKKAELQLTQQQNTLQNEVTSAFYSLLKTKTCMDNFNDTFLAQVEVLNTNANINYNKRNISLLEYIDLQRIYIENKIQFMDIRYQYLSAINKLNFSVGLDVIK